MASRLRAFPVELVEADDGVLLVRGSTVVQIRGQAASAIVRGILDVCSGEGIDRQELLDAFPEFARSVAAALVEELIDRRILVIHDDTRQPPEGEESALEVLRWEIGLPPEGSEGRLSSKTVVVVGVNHVTRRVCENLKSWAIEVHVLDDARLRNPEFFDERGEVRPTLWPPSLGRLEEGTSWLDRPPSSRSGCVVMGSEYRAQGLMRDANRYCIDHGLLFLPVALNGSVGFVGPLVVPREGACFECLVGRENSNIENLGVEDALRSTDARNRGRPGFHPAMASVLGDFAAMELIKFSTAVIPWRIGSLIEINLLSPELTTRRVLKLPRCPVCGIPEKHPGISALSRSLGVLPEAYRETPARAQN